MAQKRAPALTLEMYFYQATNLRKQEWNVGYAVDALITNMKKPRTKQQLKNTRIKHIASVKRQRTQAIRKTNQKIQKTSVQIEKKTRIDVEAKLNNLQKIQESTKKEHNRYKAKRLKHEKDTVKEVVEALSNANFDKIQVYSTKDTEREMQKTNSIIEKESVTRK